MPRKNPDKPVEKSDDLAKLPVLAGTYIKARTAVKEFKTKQEASGKELKRIVEDHGEEYPSKHSEPNKILKVKIGTIEHSVSVVYSATSVPVENIIEVLKSRISNKRALNKVVKKVTYEEIDFEALDKLIENEVLDDSVLEDLFEEKGKKSINVK